MAIILGLVCLLLALAGVVVRKTYYAVPLHELKRQAERHDPVATRLYAAAAYGGSLRALLWLYIGLTSAGSFILLARHLPWWLSLLIVGPVLWIAFSWLPASRVTRLGTQLTLSVTSAVTWLLNYLHPILGRSSEAIQKRAREPHTGLYERSDLLALIEQQQHQLDNRLSDEELEIIKRTLSFDEHQVGDILIPRKQVKSVKPDDTVGPLLIDEIHKRGSGYALVREKPKDPVVGTLAFSELGVRSTGKVKNIMSKHVYYLHEQDSLSQTLHAFFVTNHPVFLVVNNFEEFLGIVTVESVLKKLLGHVPGEDFDEYSNLVAVAARHHKPDEEDMEPVESEVSAEEVSHEKPDPKTEETPVETEEEVVE